MKTLNLTQVAFFAITAALFAEPAFAGQLQDSTFSRTSQSDTVLSLIETMRAGKLKEFRALLDGQALNLYGTEKGMHELLERFDRLSASASAPVLNIKTHLAPTLRPDTLIFSNHAYSVDVMRSAQDAPIWNVSVNCMNLILIESFGTPEGHCRIDAISASERRDGTAEPRGFAGLRTDVVGKQLSGEELTPSEGRTPSAALANDQ